MNKENELSILGLLLQIINDKSVQKRFATTTTCNMATGELHTERVIDRCEEYLINRINTLCGEDWIMNEIKVGEESEE